MKNKITLNLIPSSLDGEFAWAVANCSWALLCGGQFGNLFPHTIGKSSVTLTISRTRSHRAGERPFRFVRWGGVPYVKHKTRGSFQILMATAETVERAIGLKHDEMIYVQAVAVA